MLSLSYIGLATAIGQQIDIPIITRSLAQHYEEYNKEDNNLALDDRMHQYLISGNIDIPDGHIQTFDLDWWNDPKPRKDARILNRKDLKSCLDFHAREVKSYKTRAATGAGPAVPPAPNKKTSNFLKPSYGWHRNTWDGLDGNHCTNCRLYRAVGLGAMDQLRDLQNLISALQSAHQAERTLSQRDAAGLNMLYEEAIIMEGSANDFPSAAANTSAAATFSATAGPPDTATSSPTAMITKSLDAQVSSKWTWGVSLSDEYVRNIVRGIDTGFILPHSGYDSSLDDNSLPSDSSRPKSIVYRELDDEITNLPIYEEPSEDIYEVPDLDPNDATLTLIYYPLPGAGVKWPLDTPQDSSSHGKGKKRMWLVPPPDDYVQRPLPPLRTNDVPIGSDPGSAIYIGTDDEVDAVSAVAAPVAAPASNRINVYIDSDIEIVDAPPPPIEIFVEDSPIIKPDDIFLADSPTQPAADRPLIDHIYIPDDDDIYIPECEDIYVPEDDDIYIPDDEDLDPKRYTNIADIYIPEDDVESAAAEAVLSGPYTSADFADFDDQLLGD
jgi:hypothetical protein